MDRFLVVDDDTSYRSVLKAWLSEFGPCDLAESGKEGLVLFKEAIRYGNPYSLICTDLKMPDLNGHAFILEIRSLEKTLLQGLRTKIVVITSSNSIYDKSNLLLENLCDRYLVKPFDKNMLIACL